MAQGLSMVVQVADQLLAIAVKYNIPISNQLIQKQFHLIIE